MNIKIVSNIIYKSLSYAEEEFYHREIMIEVPIRQAYEILANYIIYFDNLNCVIELVGSQTDGMNQKDKSSDSAFLQFLSKYYNIDPSEPMKEIEAAKESSIIYFARQNDSEPYDVTFQLEIDYLDPKSENWSYAVSKQPSLFQNDHKNARRVPDEYMYRRTPK